MVNALNYPTFALSDCTPAIRRLFEADDGLIEAFTPSLPPDYWVMQDSPSVRLNVDGQKTVLYRKWGVSTGERMEDLTAQVLLLGKTSKRVTYTTNCGTPSRLVQTTPHKRSADVANLDTTPSRNVKARSMSPQQTPTRKGAATIPLVLSDDDDDDDDEYILPSIH